MDAPLDPHDALIRPWRTATLVASLVAAVELVLLLGAAFLLLAKPLSHAMQRHAEAARLAHDLHVKVVGPLDGVRPSALRGAQLAIVLGAR